MTFPDNMTELVIMFLPLLATCLIVGGALWTAHQLLIARQPGLGNERLFSRQLSLLGMTIAGLLAVILALPVSDSTRNQIIGLIGLLISGIFAFSSSTIFANLMAGIMLRITKPFRTGDFVRIGDYFGRVVERGLLDTELQTENRELVALPNTYMITVPATVTRSSGTIISVTLSLGYDIHHAKLEDYLLRAASDCGLEEPFVQIVELGDFSVTYKISGMLTDVKSLLTARSNLFRYVLDTLHGEGVEIMSPSFMNQRRLADDMKIIPKGNKKQSSDGASIVETVAFDKADQAVQNELARQQLIEEINDYKKSLAEAGKDEKKIFQEKIDQTSEQLKSLEAIIREQKGPEARP